MSTDPSATQAKADGSNAWSAGNYDLAIEHFSTAIKIGGDKEFLKILHSNRSAAYLKVKKVDEALKDGNKCVELDSNWGKGYTRKGDALLAAKKYTDAYNAYNYGLRVAPGDATLTEKCEQAMKAMRWAADQEERQSANAGFGSSGSAFPSSNASASVPVTGYVYYAKLAVLVLSVAYLLPLGRTVNGAAFKGAAGLFALSAVNSLYKAYGMPKFTSEYGMKVVLDPATMKVFLGVFLLASRPYIFPLASVFMQELTAVTPVLLEQLKAQVPQIQARYQPLINQYVPSLAGQDLSALVRSITHTQFNGQLLKGAATCEVMQGVFLLVELILPTRNVMQLFLWWQYLQMRFMLDQGGQLKGAFKSLDSQITTLLNHRLCPAALRTGYGYVKAYLAKQVTPPTGDAAAAGQGGIMGRLSSMASKCNIM